MDTNFNKILEELTRIHTEFPDMRFGQVIQMSIDDKKKSKNYDITDISSKQILNGLKEFKEVHKIKRREFKILKNPIEYAIKIVLNSFYGASGNPVFKNIYNRTTVSDCTLIGRKCIELDKYIGV